MATLKLKNINKVYPNGVQSVFDFNLDIEDKEFIVFVGPSGCGKSTTLRMIAGLEEITSGEFYINDELVNDKSSKDRDIAMVFQSYALYPHMSVYENMAFGLRLRKKDKSLGLTNDVIDQKVRHAAEILGLTPYLDRKPKALSGGQRQRVALGRAIVRNAQVFLMDEPLSNLDAKLRVSMRSELIKLHKRLQTTTIYVTHDQIEAMTMASKIVVMSHGHIQQVGTPKEIYDNPENMFVGGFIGTPPMNFIDGRIDQEGYFVASDGKRFYIPKSKLDIIKANKFIGKEIILGIRPEDIHDDNIVIETYPKSTMDFEIDIIELLGAHAHIYTYIGENKVAASIDARYDVSIGDTIKVAFDMNKCHFFDPVSEKVLKINGNILLLEQEKQQIELEKQQQEQALQKHLEELKETNYKQYKLEVYKLETAKKEEEKKAKRLEKARKVKQPLSTILLEKAKSSIKNLKQKKSEEKLLVDLILVKEDKVVQETIEVLKGKNLKHVHTESQYTDELGNLFVFKHWALQETPEVSYNLKEKVLENKALVAVYELVEQEKEEKKREVFEKVEQIKEEKKLEVVSAKEEVIEEVKEEIKEEVTCQNSCEEAVEVKKEKKSCCHNISLNHQNYEQLADEELPKYLLYLENEENNKKVHDLEKEMQRQEEELYALLNKKETEECGCVSEQNSCPCTEDENCGCVEDESSCGCEENNCCVEDESSCECEENNCCVEDESSCECVSEQNSCPCTEDENSGCVEDESSCECEENNCCVEEKEEEIIVIKETKTPENTVVIQNTVEEVVEENNEDFSIIKNTTYEMKLDLTDANKGKPLVVRNSFSKNRKENTFKKQIYGKEENKK